MVVFQSNVNANLTKTQQDILNLLVNEFLTVKQIASIRQKTTQSIYKIIRKLKKKGAFTTGHQKVAKIDVALQPFATLTNNPIRLHGERWVCKILHKADGYRNFVGASSVIDENTVRCHRDVIIIYSTQSFFGSDTYAATAKSIDYWNSYFAKIEHNFNVVLVKPRYTNIHRVRAEYAQINNGLAEKCLDEHKKVRIRAKEDGRIWFEIDNSFNFKEAETKHAVTAERDMQEVVEPFFNDLRDNEHLPLSQISSVIADTSKQINEITYAVSALANSQQALTNTLKAMLPKKEDQEDVPKEPPTYFG